MEQEKQIQWFPGHMAKTRRRITEDLRLVDVAAELLDARIPQSSRNPILGGLIQRKPHVVILNKSDLADPRETKRWMEALKGQGQAAVAMDAKTGKGLSAFYPLVQQMMTEQLEAWRKKGIIGRPIRIMVVGIPNVGKSSLINRMLTGSGAGKAAVRDKPGVTRQNAWFKLKKGFELLDTPGVLWPKFEDPEVGRCLAYTGAVKDEIMDLQELAAGLLSRLLVQYPQALDRRYGVQPDPEATGHEVLAAVGRKRGMLVSGGEIDLERTAVMVMDEFRGGKLGQMTLEQVPPRLLS